MTTIHHADPTIAHIPKVIADETNTAGGPGEPRRREPVWRVVGGSIAIGLVGGLVLTVGIFGGATEPVISGSALLAFASGWAMLAVLSGRCTSRHQRWARVPAAAMAVAGVALLIGRPGDHTLTVAGWVWPPFAAALAVWMLTRIRRGFDGRVRWLLYPIVASMALGAVGAMYETAAAVHDHHRYRAPGALYDVGGHRLHLVCEGEGSPTVVLENGLGEVSADWIRIGTEVARTTRVCAYDRAGQGWSDDVHGAQDALAIATDLHTLLARAGEQGPFLLVGHSAGGPYVMTFAAHHPNDVAGMVLLDSMSPDAFTALAGFATEQSMMHRGLGLLPSLTRLGIGRLLPTSAWSSLPEPAASQVKAFSSSPRGMRNLRDEQSRYRTVFAQAKALASLRAEPLVVLIAAESVHQHKEWVDLQARLSALSANSQHRIVDATHAGLVDDATGSQFSVQAITDVIHSIRTGQPLPAR